MVSSDQLISVDRDLFPRARDVRTGVLSAALARLDLFPRARDIRPPSHLPAVHMPIYSRVRGIYREPYVSSITQEKRFIPACAGCASVSCIYVRRWKRFIPACAGYTPEISAIDICGSDLFPRARDVLSKEVNTTESQEDLFPRTRDVPYESQVGN